MKILSFYQSEIGLSRGTPIRVRALLQGLAEKDDVELTIVSRDSENPVPEAAHIRIAEGLRAQFHQLRTLARTTDADVIIGHTMISCKLLFLLRFFTRAKIVLEMHGFLAEEGLLAGKINKFTFWRNKLFYRLCYWLCDLVTTSSPTATKIVAYSNRNAHTVFNSADLDMFSPRVAGTYLLKKSPEDIVIGYCGNTRSYQGLDFLLSSFEAFSKDHPHYVLALLLSESFKTPDTGRVRHFPKVPHEQVPAFLASCDILVIPRPECEVNRISFPSKLLEYMSMGKAVVASTTSDVGEVVRDGVDGLLFAPGDTSGFCKALDALSNQSFRERIGKEARTTAETRFSRKHMQEHFYSLVMSLTK